MKYKAYVVSETDGGFTGEVKDKELAPLGENMVQIEVHYSSVNYKDMLSASGNKGVTRNYPHVPGIDASGIVTASDSDKFQIGDKVLVTGYDLGMNTSGGYQEYIQVPSDWVVALPEGLSLKESMILGTAGFTAGLSVKKIVDSGIKPSHGPVVVTGATGGVGSIAVSILAKLGYEVVAASGKPEKTDYIKDLGASEIIHRKDLDDTSGRPMLRGRFAAGVDTVGGNTLATVLKMMNYGGVVTNCGLVHDDSFTSSVFPFILKGVSLLGIDSVQCPLTTRLQVWTLLAEEFKPNNLDQVLHVIGLNELGDTFKKIKDNKHSGRTIVKIK